MLHIWRNDLTSSSHNVTIFNILSCDSHMTKVAVTTTKFSENLGTQAHELRSEIVAEYFYPWVLYADLLISRSQSFLHGKRINLNLSPYATGP